MVCGSMCEDVESRPIACSDIFLQLFDMCCYPECQALDRPGQVPVRACLFPNVRGAGSHMLFAGTIGSNIPYSDTEGDTASPRMKTVLLDNV